MDKKEKNLHQIRSMLIKFHMDIAECHTAPYPRIPVAVISAPAQATTTPICLSSLGTKAVQESFSSEHKG